MGGRLCKSPPWIPFLFTAILFPMGKRKAETGESGDEKTCYNGNPSKKLTEKSFSLRC